MTDALAMAVLAVTMLAYVLVWQEVRDTFFPKKSRKRIRRRR